MKARIYFFVLLLALATLGVLNMFGPGVTTNFAYIQPGPGDAMFNGIVLEHVYKSFFDAKYPGNFYSPIFFYSSKLTLTLSDNLLGSAPIYWVLRLFFDPILAFQLWEIVICVLTFIAYAWFLRWLKVDILPATVVAFVFSFGSFRVQSVAHPQLFAQFYTPILFVFLFRFLKSPSIKDFNGTMLFLFLQTLAGYYLGWFLIFSLIIFGFVYLILSKNEIPQLKNFVKASPVLGKSVAFWVFLFLLFWSPYIYTSSKYKYTSGSELVMEVTPTFMNYLVPLPGGVYDMFKSGISSIFNTPKGAAGYGAYLFTGLFGIFVAYAGVGLLRTKDLYFELKFAKAFFITGLILTVLSFKIFEQSLWLIVYNIVPGADGVRYTHRIWVASFFYFFTAFAIYWKNFGFAKKFLGFCLLMFFVAEQLVLHKLSYAKTGFEHKVDVIAHQVRKNNCDAFYVKTDNDEKLTLQFTLAAMRASLDTNVPTVNGYSGLQLYRLEQPLNLPDIAEKRLKGPLTPRFCYLDSPVLL